MAAAVLGRLFTALIVLLLAVQRRKWAISLRTPLPGEASWMPGG